MKYERFGKVFILLFIFALTSCDEYETITRPDPHHNPGSPQILPEAPGLVGKFSGKVQNTSHTKSGTLNIAITAYDRYSGLLTGTLTLTGFSKCFTTGIFPDPNHQNYDNHYFPQNGFGFIQASGTQAGSYSYLYFEKSDNFNLGLKLGIDDLAFYDGHDFCLEIDPVLLKRE